MTARDECGTYAGVGVHRRADEELCADCKRANAAYMARWRKRRPDLHAENVATQDARNRALRRLARMHPRDMRRLYAEEMAVGRAPQERAS